MTCNVDDVLMLLPLLLFLPVEAVKPATPGQAYRLAFVIVACVCPISLQRLAKV